MNITYQPQPHITSTMFDGKDLDLTEAKESGRIIVEVSNDTKTRLRISIRHKEKTLAVNYVPPTSAHFKFFETAKTSFWSGNRVAVSYFVVSKKQNVEALEQHIKNIVADVFKLQPEDAFEIVIWVNRTIAELRLVQL